MMLKPRPYQREAIDAVRRAIDDGVQRPAVVLPTGAGKTVVFAHLAREFIASRSCRRVLVLAHREELISQAVGKIRAIAPDQSVGVVKAGRNETLADFVVGCVPTLRSERRRRQLHDVGLVIVDECHHATAQSYMDILKHFGCMSDEKGGVPAVGFTATMSRGDGSALGKVWQEIVYTRQISEMIRDGHLVRPRGIRIKVDDLDLSRVKKSRGDYSEGDLGRAIEASLAPEAIAKACAEHAADRPTLAFAPTVHSAEVIGEALSDVGITSALVHGAMAADDRRRALESFRAGDVQALANCMVLTEGTDLPLASCAVIARPTTHQGLYVQMAGRVLRLAPGKTDALVLDVVGASVRHSLNAGVDLFGDEIEREPSAEEDDAEDDAGIEDLLDGGGSEPEVYANGPLVAEEVDLFRDSSSAWLRTFGGTWFLPAGERYIALIPSTLGEGGWDVVAMNSRVKGESRWVRRGVSDLGYAMAWAEGDVTPTETSLARKGRSWQSSRPSDAQVTLARRMGIVVMDGMRSGELSGQLAVTFASRRIDPIMASRQRA